MAIDLGNSVIGTPPTSEQITQIKNILGLGNIQNIALSSWSGTENLSLSSSQIVNFTNDIEDILINMGGIIRETQAVVPVNNQVLTVRNGVDTTLFLDIVSSLSSLDISFPTGVDGQTVLIVPPSNGVTTIFCRLLWHSGGSNSLTMNAGNTYAYQYIAGTGYWRAI